MTENRGKLFRVLFFVGLALLLLAASGFLLLARRSFPREAQASRLQGADLKPPTQTPTITPTPTLMRPSLTPTRTPRPPTPTLTPTPARETTHVVQPGENLYRIALRYGTTVEAIAKANGISNAGAIYVGQRLTIPAAGARPTPTETATASSTPTASPTSVLITPTFTPSPGPTLAATPTPLPTMVIEAEWPKRMELERSDSVRISLVRTGDGEIVPTIEVTGHTAVADTPIPLGTPDQSVDDAFGPAYAAFAVARLQGTAFDITPDETAYQSLGQPRATWDWNILPLKPGRQVINAQVIVQWEPVGGEGRTFERIVWRSALDVSVEEPWIEIGQLNALSLVSGFLGSAFSVPWLYERLTEVIKKRREEKEKREKQEKQEETK